MGIVRSASVAVMSVAVVIVAAGSGERLGLGVPKALVELGDRTMLEWSVRAFHEHPSIDSLVVVGPAQSLSALGGLAGTAQVVAGGVTRQESVLRGLAVLADAVEFVLVHDAARPLVTAAVISSVVDALVAGADAVIPVLPVVDTVKRVDPSGQVLQTVDRSDLRLVQTPQGFRRTVLVAAHAGTDAPLTDDAGLVEAAGLAVRTVPGDEQAFKVTTAHDLRLARQLVAS